MPDSRALCGWPVRELAGELPSWLTTARGGAAPRFNFEEAAGNPFSFEAFDEGEVGDASPWWWAGTVRVDHLANMSISRSLHRSGLRGTVDPVFVQTASLSRPPTFHRAQELSAFASISESHAGGSRRRGGGGGKNGWTHRNPQSATLGSPFAREPLTVVRALQQGGDGAGLILGEEEGA